MGYASLRKLTLDDIMRDFYNRVYITQKLKAIGLKFIECGRHAEVETPQPVA